MKTLISTCAFALMLISTISKAQTATNFTATDCNSASHTLFTELDAGKIIVMAWVMPCGACIDGAKAGWDAAQSFAVSNPGKVLFYLVDDNGNSTCASLASWATANSVGSGSLTSFNNAGNVIKMSDYGASGMPKVVVLAGSTHSVLFNANSTAANNQAGITSAINIGLSPAGIKEKTIETFTVYPNPTSNTLSITGSTTITKAVIRDMNGKMVQTISNKDIKSVSVTNLATGNYSIQLYNRMKVVSIGTFTKK